jgi:hypothetical protein
MAPQPQPKRSHSENKKMPKGNERANRLKKGATVKAGHAKGKIQENSEGTTVGCGPRYILVRQSGM